CFDEKEDLQAFLINLPDSADNKGRIRAAYPDWHEATPEQRNAYRKEDRAKQRAIAEEKIRAGTAQAFNMDLEGRHGPHAPQQIETKTEEPPLRRAQRQLRGQKAQHWSGLSEADKLRVIEGEIDWSGVPPRNKEALLADEIDFAKITPEQFKFVYAD